MLRLLAGPLGVLNGPATGDGLPRPTTVACASIIHAAGIEEMFGEKSDGRDLKIVESAELTRK